MAIPRKESTPSQDPEADRGIHPLPFMNRMTDKPKISPISSRNAQLYYRCKFPNENLGTFCAKLLIGFNAFH